MLPAIQKGALESSKASNIGIKARTLKQHLCTPTDFQVPQLPLSNLQITQQPVHIQPNRVATVDIREEKVLDGFSLLENAGISLPDDVIFGDLADKKYTSVNENDLYFFTELLYLDVSENYLQLGYFGSFPKLEELRLACNGITEIVVESLHLDKKGFTSLQFLDLSYNRLSVSSTLSLGTLPSLRELNLSGNQLQKLPMMKGSFQSLEKINLENNKFEGSAVFEILCDVPNLRDISLAYNFLSDIPGAFCESNKFRLLETLDLAYNYFGVEKGVEGVLKLSRLRSLLLYGNPLLGPSGEDPHFIYIEDLACAARDVRDGPGLHPLEIITEKPRKRSYKKGEDLGRRLLSYKSFQMAVAKKSEAERVGGKTGKDWIKEGNETLFSRAVTSVTQQQIDEENSNYDYDSDENILLHTTTDADINTDLNERSRDVGWEVETTFLTRADDCQDNENHLDDDVCVQTAARSMSGRKNVGKRAEGMKNMSIDDQPNTTRRTSRRDRERDREKERDKERDRERDAVADRVMVRVLQNENPRCSSRPPSSSHSVPPNFNQQRISSARTSRDVLDREGGRGERGQVEEGRCRIGGGGHGRGKGQSYSNSNSNFTTSDLTAYRLAVGAAESEKDSASIDRDRGRERGRDRGRYNADDDDDDDVSQVLYNRQDNSVPDFLLRGNMTETHPANSHSHLHSHPLALRTAISALRFAMRHPLTNHSSVPAKAFLAAQDHQSGTTSSKHRGSNIKTHFREKAAEREINKGKTAEMRRGSKNEDDVYDNRTEGNERRSNSGTAALTDEICNIYLNNGRGNDGAKRSKSCYPSNSSSAATTQSHLLFQLEHQFEGGRGYREDVHGKSRIDTGALNQSPIQSRQSQRNGTKAAAGVRNLIEMVDEVVSRLV